MSPPLFRCGHARTRANTVREQGTTHCITCKRIRAREQQSDDPEMRRIEYRQRYLPIALQRTRQKLRELEREACALGLPELLDEPKRLTANQILNNPEIVDQAWEREAEIARIMGRL